MSNKNIVGAWRTQAIITIGSLRAGICMFTYLLILADSATPFAHIYTREKKKPTLADTHTLQH